MTREEELSRLLYPEIWKKIDADIADDDWNGGTARNLRNALLRSARELLNLS